MSKATAGTEYWKHQHWERVLQSIPASYTVWADTSVSPTMYYAECNMKGGTDYNGTNATTVINNALGALTAGRTWQEKVLCKGDFSLPTNLIIKSHTCLEVMGRMYLANNANTPLIKNENWGTETEDYDIDIIGGLWDGNRANQTITEHHGLSLRSVYDVRIFNTHVKSMEGYYGIYVAPFGNQPNVRTIIADNFIEDIADATYGYGIFVTGAAYQSVIANNIIWNSHGGVIIEDNVNGVSCLGNLIFDLTGGNGISITTSTDLLIANNKIKNVTGTGRGITTDVPGSASTHDITIADNQVSTTGYQAIYITAQNCIVNGNLAKNANQVGAVGSDVGGIELTALALYSTVVGNRCFDDQGVKTQDHGISNLANNIVIIGNDVTGNKSAGLYNTGTGVIIRDNPGYATENNGTSTGTGAQQTIAHGCAFTPTYNEVSLSERSTGGALAYQSAAPDATNIYVLATLNKDYNWKVERG